MLRGEHVMPLAVVQRACRERMMVMPKESYVEFVARMRAEGWKVKKFPMADKETVSHELHLWYAPWFHRLSKEHYPGYENEFWYKERV